MSLASTQFEMLALNVADSFLISSIAYALSTAQE